MAFLEVGDKEKERKMTKRKKSGKNPTFSIS